MSDLNITAKVQVMRIWLRRKRPTVQFKLVLCPGTLSESVQVVDAVVGDTLSVRGNYGENLQEACALTRSVISKMKQGADR